MSDLSGKQGLIVGVANKRSIAWAIAQAADRAGARLALSYATERFEENVRELAATLRQPALTLPCDVSRDDQITSLVSTIERQYGGLDFVVHAVAFASRDAISAPFVQTSREDFRVSLDISVYSLIALARAAGPLMAKRGGGSVLTLTYLGGARVFPHYNVMGVAKAALEATVRYLASDLGAREHPRQRHLRRAGQDARGLRHRRVHPHPAAVSGARAAPPQRGGVGNRGGGRLPLESRRSGRDGRGALRRRGLPRHGNVT